LSGTHIVNFVLRLLVTLLAVSSPLLASAQSVSQSLTREQVYTEMARYQAAGFNPARANPRTWVDDAQTASFRVSTHQDSTLQPRLATNGTSSACN
jgi:hypothetical protein